MTELPETQPLPEGFPQEVAAVLILASYVIENQPADFYPWAKRRKYIVHEPGCAHTDAEHTEQFTEIANQEGIPAIVMLWSLGAKIATSFLGGLPMRGIDTESDGEQVAVIEPGQYL